MKPNGPNAPKSVVAHRRRVLTVLSVTAFMVNLERVLWAANRAIAPGPSLPGSAVPSVRGSSDAGIPPASPRPVPTLNAEAG